MPQSLTKIFLHIIFSTKHRNRMIDEAIENEVFNYIGGYAAISVDPAHLDAVADYIRHQKEHHEKVSFQDECRTLFKEYGIEYDERYVWD